MESYYSKFGNLDGVGSGNMVSLRDPKQGEGVATMSLGRKDHIMTWCSASKIYKVNKFHMIDTDLRSKRRSRSSIYLEDQSDSLGGERVDIIVGLLNHNM